MKLHFCIAMVVVLATASSAQAVRLVVMGIATNATNSIIPVGEHVVTLGVQVNAADLVGAGTNPVLFVQNLTIEGNGIVPINQVGTTNKVDVQSVQSSVVDATIQEQSGPSFAPLVQSDLSVSQQQSLDADSWWYNGGTGILQGTNDDAANVGNLTDSAWQLGPIKYIGPTGFQWTPNGALGVQAGATAAAATASMNGANAVTGQYMMYSGFYGPNGANSLTGAPLTSQFVNGVLTVPIAQIATTGNLYLPGSYSNAGGGSIGAPGSGTFIGLIGEGVSNGPTGNGTYNLLGGTPLLDPGVVIPFAAPHPEPSTFVLAGLGAVGMWYVKRRRGRHC